MVGLDIEPGYIAAVETQPGSVTVERAAVGELPSDLVRDGEVLDGATLARILKAFFAEHKLGSRVRVGLANQRIAMRTIDLPPLSDSRQLDSAIRFQAQEHIAMPLDQAVLEYQSLGIVGTPDGPRSRAVLVAARRDMVERLVAAVREAGLRLEGVDLSAFAMIRALHRAADGEELVAYINLSSVTNVAVASGTLCQFTRVIPTGLDAVVADLAERRGLTRDHARGWLRHVGLIEPVESVEGQSDIVRAAREALVDGVVRIADEVRTTLDFYATQANTPTATRAVITGPALALPGFADRFGEALRLPVEMRTVVAADPHAVSGLDLGQLTVATGLTTTEAPQ